MVKIILEKLKECYPDSECTLDYAEPWQLLFSTRLAAQCTDERVNKITPALYARYNTLEKMSEADINELEEYVRTCGFFRKKAEDLKNCAGILAKKHGGILPNTIEELIKLPGVGRKTANLIMGAVYNMPAIIADTHCIRLSNRFGFVRTNDPKKVETELKKLIPPKEQTNYCHRCVAHGRAVCKAVNPKCSICELRLICPKV